MNSPLMGFARVGVIGMGQIGGSICKALLLQGLTCVNGFDIDPNTCVAARADGVAVHPSLPELVSGSDLIVLAVPLDCYAQLARAIFEVVASNPGQRILIDVGSSSLALRRAFDKLPPGLSVVGTHPMTGTERRSYAAADAALLADCNWAVLHRGDNSASAVDELRVAHWILGLGAKVIFVSPDEHDAAVARISHLPHVLAMALARTALAGPDGGLHYCLSAGSFRDGTRVAETAAGLTTAMCLSNNEALDTAISDFMSVIAAIRQHLREYDEAAVFSDFESARGLKHRFKKHFDPLTPQALSAPSAEALCDLLLTACRDGSRIETIESTLPAYAWQARLERPAKTIDN